MKLEDIQIADILPAFMRLDKANVAMAETASQAIRLLSHEIRKLSTWDAISLLTDSELNTLADEVNCLWYDKSFTAEQKRILLMQSDQVYMRLGTVKACSDVISSVFGSAKIEQFYETVDLLPHYFQIYVTDAATLSAENEAKLLRMLNQVKRKSQWLKKIYADTIAKIELKIGIGVGFQKVIYPRVDTLQDNSFNPILSIAPSSQSNSSETTAFNYGSI